MNNSDIFDIAVIGGGINGTGIAADASGRGLKVFLCEQNDLASGTSSASSKLIHGGLRYLEHYEFRLVKEALAEREILLNKAPHLVSPLKFTMPHRKHLRPAWMIRCGLFMYDHLSKRNTLPKARKVKLGDDSGFHNTITRGFEYYDCWVDDARLVVTNAIAAKENGAEVHVQTECQHVMFDSEQKCWKLKMLDKQNHQIYSIKAKNLVNASGPWLNQFIESAIPTVKPSRQIRLIKGSHIIVPKVHDKNEAFILQNEDKRVVFVLPYLDHFSIIGTTDKEYKGDPAEVAIDDWEVDYLLKVFNTHFKKQLSREQIVSTYSGIRPLCDDESDDPSAITRDYTLDLYEATENNALLSVYGGKITTYRKLAEAAMVKLEPFVKGAKPAWTAQSPLPGSAELGMSREQIETQLTKEFSWLSAALVKRYASSYGLNCRVFLEGKQSMEDLGHNFGEGLCEAEVNYLLDHEWARCAEDILARRTKLGLFLSKTQKEYLQNYTQNYFNQHAQAS